jgi:hypothetical protein
VKVIINRFEGFYAVCEKPDKTMIDIKRILLPREIKEGYVVNISNGELTIDYEETAKVMKQKGILQLKQ